MKIDWQAVRDHKMFLYSMTDSPSDWQRTNAWGLIGILHDLQSAEVDSGRATEQEVYGRDGRNAFAEMVMAGLPTPLEPGEERYRHDGFDRSAGGDFDHFAEVMADQSGQE